MELKRIEETVEEYVYDAVEELLVRIYDCYLPSRERSLAVTKLDECALWLSQAEAEAGTEAGTEGGQEEGEVDGQ